MYNINYVRVIKRLRGFQVGKLFVFIRLMDARKVEIIRILYLELKNEIFEF